MPATAPRIRFASATGPNGAVYRGPTCSKAQAVAYRSAGNDIVVCDGSTADKRKLAKEIEKAVVGAGNTKEDPAHVITAGTDALPYFQPKVQPLRSSYPQPVAIIGTVEIVPRTARGLYVHCL